MEKKRKTHTRIWGFSIGEFINFITLLISICGGIVWATLHLERRFEGIDRRLDGIDDRLNRIEVELKQTSGLLNNYLTWRFLYLHDPTRKNIEPRYDPNTRTLEFFDKNANKGK